MRHAACFSGVVRFYTEMSTEDTGVIAKKKIYLIMGLCSCVGRDLGGDWICVVRNLFVHG